MWQVLAPFVLFVPLCGLFLFSLGNARARRTTLEQSDCAGIVKNGQLTNGNVISVVSLVVEILRGVQSREALKLAHEMGLIEVS